MNPHHVCFLGTPEFASQHLLSLLSNPQFKVVGVVTQPDRPAGRRMQLQASPVKALAQLHSIPVLCPENLRRDPEALKTIQTWGAEVAVVVAFGQILSQEFLDSFSFGAVNVHGSLLPRWRGAAPIQRALEAGDEVGGVCLQKVIKKLDAGPLLGERRLLLGKEIDATELYQKLAPMGCELLNSELIAYLENQIQPVSQDEAQVTFAAKIEKEEALLDWQWTARKLHDKIRAFTMGPGTYVMVQGKRLKIHKSRVVMCKSTDLKLTSTDAQGVQGGAQPGQIARLADAELVIHTGGEDGFGLSLLEVQPESKNKMEISAFLKTFRKTMDLHEGGFFV